MRFPPGPAHSAVPLVPGVQHGPTGEAPPARGGKPRIPPPSRDELERVRMRDRTALATFFERYFNFVYALAYRLMGERTLAEDVAQDVFLKVHRAADQLDPRRDPAPWLTVITTNACRDVWRSGAFRMTQASRSIEDDPESGVTLTPGRNDPEADALAAERERLVQAAIGKLPEALRVPLVLHDFQGLDHEEIARELGIQHAAARKRYSRALTALAAILKETLG